MRAEKYYMIELCELGIRGTHPFQSKSGLGSPVHTRVGMGGRLYREVTAISGPRRCPGKGGSKKLKLDGPKILFVGLALLLKK